MLEITNSLLQYLGIISITLIISTGYLMIRNDPNSSHTSVSSYAGSAKSQAKLAFIALIVLSIPFYLWVLFWVIPTYQLSPILYPFVIISFLCHIVLVKFPLIPSNGRRHYGNLLHLAAGAIIAISMLGIVTVLALSPAIEEKFVSRFVLLGTAGYMLMSLLLYTVTREQKYFFVFEVIYILLFGLCVGVVTIGR